MVLTVTDWTKSMAQMQTIARAYQWHKCRPLRVPIVQAAEQEHRPDKFPANYQEVPPGGPEPSDGAHCPYHGA